MKTHLLAFHADYRCRNTGVCCSAGWPIPVERPVHQRLLHDLACGALKAPDPPVAASDLFRIDLPKPEDAGAILGHDARGRCLFLEASDLCTVHRQCGEGALPGACRHFPRVCTLRPHGVFITLSHFCPTAAAMLFREDADAAIVTDLAAFPPDREYEGLDARDTFPPLLRPDAIMDWTSFERWERHCVTMLTRADITPDQALDVLDRDTVRACAWRDAEGSLSGWIASIADNASEVRAPSPPTANECIGSLRVAESCVPDHLRKPFDVAGLSDEPVLESWETFRLPIGRFLAAHAFANWTACQGQGLWAMHRSLVCTRDVLFAHCALQCAKAACPHDRELLTQAFRATDLLLIHHAAPDALAARFSAAALRLHR